MPWQLIPVGQSKHASGPKFRRTTAYSDSHPRFFNGTNEAICDVSDAHLWAKTPTIAVLKKINRRIQHSVSIAANRIHTRFTIQLTRT